MPVQGIYAGIQYIVVEKGGKKYIALRPEAISFAAEGADLKLLNDIGNQDPDKVMARLLESIHKNRKPEGEPRICMESADNTIG